MKMAKKKTIKGHTKSGYVKLAGGCFIRTPVVSSNLASVGYDPESQILEIEFNSGRIYHYFNVPEHVYDDLLSAESIGKFFSAEIKDTYGFSQVR